MVPGKVNQKKNGCFLILKVLMTSPPFGPSVQLSETNNCTESPIEFRAICAPTGYHRIKLLIVASL